MPPFVLSRFFHPLISFQFFFFFFNDTPTPEIYPLSLHDALPILGLVVEWCDADDRTEDFLPPTTVLPADIEQHGRFEVVTLRIRTSAAASGFPSALSGVGDPRSEEHTSELQSLAYLVCRLLLEKK